METKFEYTPQGSRTFPPRNNGDMSPKANPMVIIFTF